MLVTGMFYTHAEVTPRIAYWSLFNGFAGIFSGILSYAVYHMNPTVFSPWKLLMIITGLMTVIVSICFWALVPDSPAKAYFLTQEEKVIAVARLRNQSTGTENKIWKKDQFLEAMTDWKSWAFLVYGAVANVSNSSGNMTALIIGDYFPFFRIPFQLTTFVLKSHSGSQPLRRLY
jgi:sugar phosphate permease